MAAGGSVCTGIALMMMYDGLRSSGGWYGTAHFWTGMRMRVLALASFATFRLCSGRMTEFCGYAVAGVLGGMVFL